MSFNFPASFPAPSGRELAWVMASYGLGCFTAGYYWTRWKTGRDIREMGSGNVGARNVGRTLGPGGFAVTLLLDAAKGFLAVVLAGELGLRPEAVVAALVAVVAGHNWPVQLRFQGGKGIAVSVGGLLALDPWLMACVVGVFLPVLLILRNFTLSGLLAFSLGPLVIFLCGWDKIRVAALSLVAILALITHRKNIRQEIARLTGGSVKEDPVPLHRGPHDEV